MRETIPRMKETVRMMPARTLKMKPAKMKLKTVQRIKVVGEELVKLTSLV